MLSLEHGGGVCVQIAEKKRREAEAKAEARRAELHEESKAKAYLQALGADGGRVAGEGRRRFRAIGNPVAVSPPASPSVSPSTSPPPRPRPPRGGAGGSPAGRNVPPNAAGADGTGEVASRPAWHPARGDGARRNTQAEASAQQPSARAVQTHDAAQGEHCMQGGLPAAQRGRLEHHAAAGGPPYSRASDGLGGVGQTGGVIDRQRATGGNGGEGGRAGAGAEAGRVSQGGREGSANQRQALVELLQDVQAEQRRMREQFEEATRRMGAGASGAENLRRGSCEVSFLPTQHRARLTQHTVTFGVHCLRP